MCSNIFNNNNNTNYYNKLYAHLIWITDETRANPFCYYHALRLILKSLSQWIHTQLNRLHVTIIVINTQRK